MTQYFHWRLAMGGGGGGIGDARTEWATETDKRGNPGRLRGIRWAYSVLARATTAHMWPYLLLECKLDTVDYNIESFHSHCWGNKKSVSTVRWCVWACLYVWEEKGSVRGRKDQALLNLNNVHISHLYRFPLTNMPFPKGQLWNTYTCNSREVSAINQFTAI